MPINDNLANLITGVKEADLAFKNFYTSSEGYFNNINNLIGSAGKALSSIPFVGGIVAPFKDLMINVSNAAAAIDGLGDNYRKITTNNLEFASSIGKSIDNVVELNTRLSDIEKTNSALSRSGFFINTEDTIESFRQLKQYAKDSSSEFLNYRGSIDGVTVSAEQMTAVLQEVSGLESYSYYSTLNKLISQQGQTFDEAIKTIVSYKDISKETGLSVSTVSSALENSVNYFSKLGLSVNFAKPALEGFSSVMKQVGLGISEASSLTSTLSNSLINVANDYGKAYVMFQQGGLDFGGGGGAIGSSIGFRAKMLGASQEEQEQIGLDMIKAMRDTLSNLTGGQGIVDVRQAAESPELQSRYLQQEQLLSSIFSISNQGDRDRTLELLSQIDLATQEGNKDRAMQLSEELSNAQKAREETKSSSEKLGAIASGSLFEHIRQTALLQKQLELTIIKDEDFAKRLFAEFKEGQPQGTSTIGDLAGKYMDQLLGFTNNKIEQLSGMINSSEFTNNELMKTLAARQVSESSLSEAVEQNTRANLSTAVSQSAGNTVNISITNNGAPSSSLVVVDPSTGSYREIPRNDSMYAPLASGLQSQQRANLP